ncbi:hypothetical protein HYR99_31520 [Candidatus Poribacteria bacterium]|nr:hypothetical protein [Candidatus Poribacteria bacterium]
MKNIDFRIAPFKKGTWKTYNSLDGLTNNMVWVIHRGPDGPLWFGTYAGGLSRFDGKQFVNFTEKDGLAHDRVSAIHHDPHGALWFGTVGGLS